MVPGPDEAPAGLPDAAAQASDPGQPDSPDPILERLRQSIAIMNAGPWAPEIIDAIFGGWSPGVQRRARGAFKNTEPTAFPLSKYSPVPSTVVEPSSKTAVLSRADGDWQKPTQGAHLAPNRFATASKARCHLSLTYEPSLAYTWPGSSVMKWLNADLLAFEDVYGHPNQFNRVWPAFGNHGGGLETVLVDGHLKCGQPALLDADDVGDWRMEDTAIGWIDPDRADPLLDALYGWADRVPDPSGDDPEAADPRGEHDGYAKLQPGGLAVTLPTAGWYITTSLSSLHRNDQSLTIRLDVAVWRDVLRWRQIWEPDLGEGARERRVRETIKEVDLGEDDDLAEEVLEHAEDIWEEVEAEITEQLNQIVPGLARKAKTIDLPEPYLEQDYYIRPAWVGLAPADP